MNDLQTVRRGVPDFTYNDYLRALPLVERLSSASQPLRVAVLRSYTVEPIEPVLKVRLALEGFNPEIWFGGFNQFVREILESSGPLHEFQPDLVLLMVRLEEFMPDFLDDFGGRSPADWEAVVDAKAQDFGALARAVRENLAAQLIVQNMYLPSSYWGIHDVQDPQGQAQLVGRLNRGLARTLQGEPGAFVWDFSRLVQRTGYDHIADPKMWFTARSPYRQSVYPLLVDDLLPYLLSMRGKSTKCVVVDLDNTLWGGVVGEDGIQGIHLGHTYPGNCYREFQKELLKLFHRGVILAINSKNNEADAMEVIDAHPDMVLRRRHFASWQINWNDKATNMRALADDLNIGLDSMIMLDDSAVECEQIRLQLPDCRVVCLPEQPYLIPGVCLRLPGIERISLTTEDRKKGEMYQTQIARKRQESAAGSLDEFLASLKLEVSIEPASPFSVPRIAQLTQKTNQMNLTTRRYTEAEIAALSAAPDASVYSIAASDRFGDNGTVGVIILKVEGEECRIDTLLLSCRVIGREIERAMIAFIAEIARRRGMRRLVGEYLPTAKNQPAADLYRKLGFEQLGPTLFRAELERQAFEVPTCIRLTGMPGGEDDVASAAPSRR